MRKLYSVLSLTAESSFGALPKALCWLIPIPLTTLWGAGDMAKHGVIKSVGVLAYLQPTTFQTTAILGAWAGVFLMLLSVLLTLFSTTALDGTVRTFSFLRSRYLKTILQ